MRPKPFPLQSLSPLNLKRSKHLYAPPPSSNEQKKTSSSPNSISILARRLRTNLVQTNSTSSSNPATSTKSLTRRSKTFLIISSTKRIRHMESHPVQLMSIIPEWRQTYLQSLFLTLWMTLKIIPCLRYIRRLTQICRLQLSKI